MCESQRNGEHCRNDEGEDHELVHGLGSPPLQGRGEPVLSFLQEQVKEQVSKFSGRGSR